MAHCLVVAQQAKNPQTPNGAVAVCAVYRFAADSADWRCRRQDTTVLHRLCPAFDKPVNEVLPSQVEEAGPANLPPIYGSEGRQSLGCNYTVRSDGSIWFSAALSLERWTLL